MAQFVLGDSFRHPQNNLLTCFCFVLFWFGLSFSFVVVVCACSLHSSQSPQFGISPPISVDPPKQEDVEQAKLLVEYLSSQGSFEPVEETQKREEVLGRLEQLCQKAVAGISMRNGFKESEAYSFGTRMYTFGSFRLGVHGSGADIDTYVDMPCLFPFFYFFRQADFLSGRLTD